METKIQLAHNNLITSNNLITANNFNFNENHLHRAKLRQSRERIKQSSTQKAIGFYETILRFTGK